MLLSFIAPVFDTTPPGVRAATDGLRWHASRESHPSEDRSELPPLLVAVAGQEYHYQIADEGRCETARHRLFCGRMGTALHLSWPSLMRAYGLHRWSWRILQRRFSPLSRASRQRTYPVAGYEIVKLQFRIQRLFVFCRQSKFGKNAVHDNQILTFQVKHQLSQ